MDFDTYRSTCLGSERTPKVIVTDRTLVMDVLEVAVAAGELVDAVKRAVIYGKGIDYSALRQKTLEVLSAAEEASRSATSRPAAGPSMLETDVRLLHAGLGLFGEAGELLESLLANIRGEPLDVKNLVEETGDSGWYFAMKLDQLELKYGVPAGTVFTANLAKLQARYPTGAFRLSDTLNRDKAAEMAAVEAAMSKSSVGQVD